MRIATWNVNGLRARLDFVRHWLEARDPDLVGLQELKLADDQFPVEVFDELGYHSACHGQKAWNGVAVLSKQPIEVFLRDLPEQEELGSRLLAARTAGIAFTTLYVPNGKHLAHPDFAAKLVWLDTLADTLEALLGDGEAGLLCGDFNVCPTASDSWSEEELGGTIFHTAEERDRIRSLLDSGLVDLYRDRHPDGRAFSWWDYRGGAFHRGHGLRIDLILGTRAVRERLSQVIIDRDYRKKHDGLTPSDHAPVIADLD